MIGVNNGIFYFIYKDKKNMIDFLEKIRKCKSMSGVVRMINNDDQLLDFVINRTNYLDNSVYIYERLFNIKNDFFTIQLCFCKTNKLKWSNKQKKYLNSCGDKKCRIETREPEKEKIRVEKILTSKRNKTDAEKQDTIKKMKKTLIQRYGQDSYAKTDEFKKFMTEKIGVVSPFELKKTHDKSKISLKERYNVDHNFKIPSVKEKRKQTFLKNWGVDNPTKSDEIKNKIINTNNKRYGGNSPLNNKNIQEKSISTLINNYGVSSPLLNEKIREKYETTMLNLYGVKYWIQNGDNLEKMNNGRSIKKEFIINSGSTVYLQGYEDYFLYEVLLKKYQINDICITNKDKEKYIGKIYYTLSGKTHRYYPDFYVVSENKIYEIKSQYTYNNDLIVNKIKRDACVDKGINFEFFILESSDYKKWKKKNKSEI